MPKRPEEEELTGGNVNGAVTRIGETVRRNPGPNSAVVHKLLLHLEAKGFDPAPRFLGRDDKNREILSFLPGSNHFDADLWTTPDPLKAAILLLKDYHQAVSDFDWGNAEDWAYAWPDPSEREVVCHNDFAPYNMLFHSGVPTGIVDFDLAGPAPRLRDLAYLAYWMVPLSFGEGETVAHSKMQLKSGLPRLRRILDIYGNVDPDALLDMVDHVLSHMSSEAACAKMMGKEAAARLREGDHFAHWERERLGFTKVLPDLRKALSAT